MAKQTRTTLKSYFNTGDYPTEQNFADLIESARNLEDDGYSLVVTVAMFPDVGDYVCDGTDDDVQIQEAIDSLGSSGGTVFIKKGVYNTASNPGVKVRNKHITVTGEGKQLTILRGSAGHDLFNVGSDSGDTTTNLFVTVKNLTLDVETNQGQAAFVSSGVSHVTLDNVEVRGSDNVFCVFFAGPSGGTKAGVVDGTTTDKYNAIINCDIYGNYGGDILSWSLQQYGIISNCRIDGRIAAYYGRDCVFSGNYLGTSSSNTNCPIWATAPFLNNSITGNTVTDFNGAGIRIAGGDDASDLIYGNVIVGNSIDGKTTGGRGIQIGNYSSPPHTGITKGNTITGNAIMNCVYYGIDLGYSHYNTVSGNVCRDNNSDGIHLYESTNNIINGNQCIDLRTTPGQNYGIRLTHNSDDNYVDNNILTGNTTKDIFDDSADNTVIDRNSGRVRINRGIEIAPSSSETPTNNGDVVIEATSDTSITFKLKGSDGTVRSGSVALT